VIDKDKTFQTAYNELYRLQVLYEKNMDAGEQTLKLGYRNNPKAYAFLTSLAMHYSFQGRKDDMLKVLQQIKSCGISRMDTWWWATFTGGWATPTRRTRSIARPGAGSQAKTVYQKRIVEAFMARGKAAEARTSTARY